MKWFLYILILIAGCTGATLADRITLGLVQNAAKENGQYCYTTDFGDNFCLIYKGQVTK